MLSRDEAIRQALASIEPKAKVSYPHVSFGGAASHVNIISHATINIESINILPEEALTAIAELLHEKERKCKARKGKGAS